MAESPGSRIPTATRSRSSSRSPPRTAAGDRGAALLLVDAEAAGTEAPELSKRLLEHGRIAATPMTAWGSEVAPRYVRLVYAREPLKRLQGIGERVRAAL